MDENELIRTNLQDCREAMLFKLEGLSDADIRRAVVPSGTNLLGLVKHLTGVEFGYLGDSFGRAAYQKLPWVEDGSINEGADMWVADGESTDYIVGLYRQAWVRSDETLAALELDTVGKVPWWPAERQGATLRQLAMRVLVETARHAGHADICREMIDGAGGRFANDPSFYPIER